MNHPAKNPVIEALLRKGVRMPLPSSVDIGADIQPERISGDGVILYPGCRLSGSRTLIMAGAELGYEAPATVVDCLLGRNVKLKGGFFHKACFLDGASMGSGAQVREGCLLEEKSRGAHCVGLKQTILFPFVTLGSLVNFCDCLMAGGTDEKNHSEVGSSYIHFNYTPNQDKATASLIGDVPSGVMLNQPPIFLGGQGGMVGPMEVAYGTVAAAGNLLRKDISDRNTLVLGQKPVARSIPFHPGLYSQLKRIVHLNVLYIGNLAALRQWYLSVRSRCLNGEGMETALHAGAIDTLSLALRERIKRLGEIAQKLPRSMALLETGTEGKPLPKSWHQQHEFCERWPEVEEILHRGLEYQGTPELHDEFLNRLENAITRGGSRYLTLVKGFDAAARDWGTRWLQEIVDHFRHRVMQVLPQMNVKGVG